MYRIDHFFETAVERERIRMSREEGNPAPWTDDPIFQQFRFCNVFREDDRVTQWLRVNLRDPLRNQPQRVAKAVAIFRIPNFIPTAERWLPMLRSGRWDRSRALAAMEGAQQVVTGAYMVRTPWGMDKLHGVVHMVDTLLDSGVIRRLASRKELTLQQAHQMLAEIPFQGPFTAYEMVTDLRHTCLLEHALDINTWANPGPGARRGLEHVFQRKLGWGVKDRAEMLYLMRELLRLSRPDACHWPEGWRQWEMREVEHWLCEYDKYRRAQLGQRLKRRFP